MTLGERIRIKREEKGLSQLELAQKSGYETKSAISLIEANKRDIPLDKVRKIAKVLEVSPNWLMGWVDDPLAIKTDLEITIDTIREMSPELLKRVRDYAEYLKYEEMKK